MALDSQRKEEGLSWRQLAKQAGVSPSTLTRMQQGKRPDVDTFGALVQWLNIPAEEFLLRPEHEMGEKRPSARVKTVLRAKRELSPDAADALQELLDAAERFTERTRRKKR